MQRRYERLTQALETLKLRIAGRGEPTGHRWIPLTKGQQCGKFAHVMTSPGITQIGTSVYAYLSSLKSCLAETKQRKSYKGYLFRCYERNTLQLQWRPNGLDGVSIHHSHHCLLSRLFGRRSKKTSKPRTTGLCARNSPGTGEFPAQRASKAENVSIWWRHRDN